MTNTNIERGEVILKALRDDLNEVLPHMNQEQIGGLTIAIINNMFSIMSPEVRAMVWELTVDIFDRKFENGEL